MISWFMNTPGRLYVLATLLPLASFVFLALGGLIRALACPSRQTNSAASFLYYLFGGDRPLRAGAYLATVVMALSAALAVTGLVTFLNDFHEAVATEKTRQDFEVRWAENTMWAAVGPTEGPSKRGALQLEVGYRIDHLTAILFAMVTVISTFIFLFSTNYMKDETQPEVVDHEVTVKESGVGGQEPGHEGHVEHDSHDHGGHLHRRGRYGRFFLFLSLFCFSMLNLLIADNVFQVFVSWELVGVCSFFLIGFYYERRSASTAANKAFIVNRIGDAGFLIGLAIVWAYFGTFNFQKIDEKLHCPAGDFHGRAMPASLVGQIVRGDRLPGQTRLVRLSPKGEEALLVPAHVHAVREGDLVDAPPVPQHARQWVPLPYWLLIVAGLGVFLGCVGKSAQFPLHTWLPDAMEGPTPVSALIHAATMVAAGVYLVGRAYPIFTPEVLLVIAYTGAVTLFIAASIALVQTDIKRVLAYSTVSQLGYMMLALGVGGWAAGELHLITHAFFKALLFLAAGAVIYGLHHEQDLRKMGGLWKKMPVTAITMLVGVLAIAGTPFFSGWYSKDQIIGQAVGFASLHPKHMALAVLPVVGAVMTAFYMFRLWLLAFVDVPRDAEAYRKAHESPWLMLIPLIVLALFSIAVGWGPDFWTPEGSYVGGLLKFAEPETVHLYFRDTAHAAHERHDLAGGLALGAGLLGAGIAFGAYGFKAFSLDRLKRGLSALYSFLLNKWYFDELYDFLFVRPIVRLAFCLGRFDKHSVIGPETEAADRKVDPTSVDGVLSAIGLLSLALGQRLRRVQTGLLRRYVLVLVLTTVFMFAILSILTGRVTPG